MVEPDIIIGGGTGRPTTAPDLMGWISVLTR
jgi:hypothetical protein